MDDGYRHSLPLEVVDNEIYELKGAELEKNEKCLVLIPSINCRSRAVMEAEDSTFADNYSEGYPDKRYYPGNDIVDEVEKLAIKRAKMLFGANYANVQPLSGSNANLAVLFALLKPGDTFMGMGLRQGGHLTHGHDVNVSGIIFKCVPYGVDENGYIDYDDVESIAEACNPRLIISGATSYSRIIDFERFGEIARNVDAYHMADMSHIAGLVAGGVHDSPVPHSDYVTSTTHKTLRGPKGAFILSNDEELAKRIDNIIFPGMQGGPLEHIIAAKAVAFMEALQPEFKVYAERVVENAQYLAEYLKSHGFDIVTNGTDNHLMLLDLTKKSYGGKEAEKRLERAGIFANRNAIPSVKESPYNPSGLRAGTPVATTRGMREKEMEEIAECIHDVLDTEGEDIVLKTRDGVEELCSKFPLYPHLREGYKEVQEPMSL